MAAYRPMDVDENKMMEKEILDLCQKREETNNTLQNMYSILKRLENNRASIVANIRCGMKTDWHNIVNTVLSLYREEYRRFEKSMKNIYSTSNSDNANYEFMTICFTINDCEQIIDCVISQILQVYEEYETARSETLNNTPIVNDVVNKILCVVLIPLVPH